MTHYQIVETITVHVPCSTHGSPESVETEPIGSIECRQTERRIEAAGCAQKHIAECFRAHTATRDNHIVKAVPIDISRPTHRPPSTIKSLPIEPKSVQAIEIGNLRRVDECR